MSTTRSPAPDQRSIDESLHAATETRTFRTAFPTVGRVRRWVRSHLADVPWLDRARRSDIEIVTSELATNAVEYGEGDVITAEIARDHDAVEIVVESDGEMADLADIVPATPTSTTGRGLTIARLLSDSLTQIVRDGRTRMRALFRRR